MFSIADVSAMMKCDETENRLTLTRKMSLAGGFYPHTSARPFFCLYRSGIRQ
jgi:hypothetical protein